MWVERLKEFATNSNYVLLLIQVAARQAGQRQTASQIVA